MNNHSNTNSNSNSNSSNNSSNNSSHNGNNNLTLKTLSYETKNELVYVGFGAHSNKSMTVLDRETLIDLKTVVERLREEASRKRVRGAIFFSHKEGCFLAGADIKMIQGLRTQSEGAKGAELGQELFNAIEDLQIPTIALVDGVCLGGGLEFVMSCTKILVSDSPKTKLGLPEVKLGILPGFGGTYRLPRRIQLPKALDLILSGRTINGKCAKKWGLAVENLDGGMKVLLEMAPYYLERKEKVQNGLKDSLENLAISNFLSRKIIFQKAREGVMKMTKGHYQAPLKILDHLQEAQGKSRASYLQLEAKAFGELCVSEQSKNLQHVFFLMEEAKKFKGKKIDSKSVEGQRAAVLGAGVMGGGIAWMLADSGHHPLMKDINKEALELGLKQASDNFSKAYKRKKITLDEYENKLRSIYPVLENVGLGRAALVIEAIVENMDIKKKVLKELEPNLSKDCLVTSNTSSLSVTEMAKAFQHPERFLGLHFFNPVHRMPLVKIVTHAGADPKHVEELYKWALNFKKTPVVVKDGPGFLVNRILMPYLNESCYLLEEGISIQELDEAALNFGMPMGPCRLMDEVGLDVLAKVANVLHAGLGERAKPTSLADKISSLKFLGRKSDRGFYLYNSRGKETAINPEVEKLLAEHSAQKRNQGAEAGAGAASGKKDWDEMDVQMRIFLPMINEACNILQEGLVDQAQDVDLGMIFGTGFPPFRGGLLRYADVEGPDNILKQIRRYEKEVSSIRYKPSTFLVNMVESGRKFYPNTSVV